MDYAAKARENVIKKLTLKKKNDHFTLKTFFHRGSKLDFYSEET